MSDPIEAAEQRRQQIVDAIERLEAAANAWREIGKQASRQTCNETIIVEWAKARTNLIACVDDLARLRGEG